MKLHFETRFLSANVLRFTYERFWNRFGEELSHAGAVGVRVPQD